MAGHGPHIHRLHQRPPRADTDGGTAEWAGGLPGPKGPIGQHQPHHTPPQVDRHRCIHHRRFTGGSVLGGAGSGWVDTGPVGHRMDFTGQELCTPSVNRADVAHSQGLQEARSDARRGGSGSTPCDTQPVQGGPTECPRRGRRVIPHGAPGYYADHPEGGSRAEGGYTPTAHLSRRSSL